LNVMSASKTNRRAFLKAAAQAAGASTVAVAGLDTLGSVKAASAAVRASSPLQGTLWGIQYPPHVDAYKRLAALFKQQTGGTITVAPIAGDLFTKIIASTAAGTQPDLACVIGVAATALFNQQVLIPVQDRVIRAKHLNLTTDWLGDAIQAFTWRGKVYGIPVEENQVGTMVSVPYLDVKALGLGSKYPPTNGKIYFESYQDMWDLAKALQVTKGGKVTRWGLSSEGWEVTQFTGLMRTMGAKWWDPEHKKFNVNSAAGVKAIELLVSTPVKLGIETQLNNTGSDVALQGRVALVHGNGGPAESGGPLGYHYEYAGSPRVTPGVDPLFYGEGGWGFAGIVKSSNPSVIMPFLEMVATTAGQLAWGKIYNGTVGPAWPAVGRDKSRFADQNPQSQVQQAARVNTILGQRTVYIGNDWGYYGSAGGFFSAIFSSVREGKITAAAAAQQLQSRLEAQYKQYTIDIANTQ